MTKTYQHVFPDKSTLTLVVSFDGALTMRSHPFNRAFSAEYERWVNEVVVPDVMRHLTPEQKRLAAIKGLRALS